MRVPLQLSAGVLVILLAVTGCTDQKEKETTPSIGGDSESQSGGDDTSPSPDGETSPQPQAIETAYPKVGVTFTKLPEATGPAADALETYVRYQVATVASQQQVEVVPELELYADPSVVSMWSGSIDAQRQQGITYGGETSYEVKLDESTARQVSLAVCVDQADTEIVQDGTSRAPDEKRVPLHIEVTRLQSWQVSADDVLDGGC